MNKDYYEILGVAKNASKEDIKRAYRKLAHRYHPDKGGGDEKKFKEINEAYQILGDDSRRTRYDQFGSADFEAGNAPSWDFSGFNAGGQGFGAEDLSDIFESFFSGAGGSGSGFGFKRRSRERRGSDVSISIDISFEEAVFGVRRSILMQRTAECELCRGSGAKIGSKNKKCASCQGTGTVRESRKSIFGSFTSLAECKSCGGHGEIPEELCLSCRGAGVKRKQENIDVDIPAGIQNGEVIKLTGHGEAVRGGFGGDLYIRINVMSHPIFRREGGDLLMDLHLPFSTMLLGNEEKIETLDGHILIKIPELSSAGDFLRVRGKGVPRSRGGRGDLLIRLFPKLPKKLSAYSKKLLEDLKKEGL